MSTMSILNNHIAEFSRSIGFKEASEARSYSVRDIVKRLGFISGKQIVLKNYHNIKPLTAFNASILVDVKRGTIDIYTRVVVGYYRYVSSIAMIQDELNSILSGSSADKYYGEIILVPTSKYDFWGVEDPRAYLLDSRPFITYAGRTINYFDGYSNLVTPVTAVFQDNPRRWEKIATYVLGDTKLHSKLRTNKNAFTFKTGEDTYLFHRAEFYPNQMYLLVSRVVRENSDSEAVDQGDHIKEYKLYDSVEIISRSYFEEKIGWATPPIVLSNSKILLLLHGVDKYLRIYRVFALLLTLRREEIVVESITPSYIMEPKHLQEIYGDRPYVVFPCGVSRIDNSLLISYGASDTFIGFGLIDLDDLLSELDKGRIF